MKNSLKKCLFENGLKNSQIFSKCMIYYFNTFLKNVLYCTVNFMKHKTR